MLPQVEGIEIRDWKAYAPAVEAVGGAEAEEGHVVPLASGVVDEGAAERAVGVALDGVDESPQRALRRGDEPAGLDDGEFDGGGDDLRGFLQLVDDERREPEPADGAEGEAVRAGVEERLAGDGAAHAAASRVTVMGSADRILPHEDPELTDLLREILESEGIRIETGVRVNQVETGPDGKEVTGWPVGTFVRGARVMWERELAVRATGAPVRFLETL